MLAVAGYCAMSALLLFYCGSGFGLSIFIRMQCVQNIELVQNLELK